MRRVTELRKGSVAIWCTSARRSGWLRMPSGFGINARTVSGTRHLTVLFGPLD